ncbi:hypothetical protein [Kordiimonas lacus]|uniref:Uncharacterized protein n=1 Tax=Kordiimonas lacus TaxID=637679 RepID=A0A1G7DFV2_9PROT|nr:hypothetical protein [Kordiimonas lacus]SDE49890.1 hypothetical protein SAMN04488071_3075 [Kordiimonas lacus]
MQFQTPTIAGLIKAAIQAAKARFELLVLLGLLAGIGSSIVYAPAVAVLEGLIEIQQETGTPDEKSAEFAAAFNDGASILLLGHLAATAVSTFLLVPFARASAPGQLVPSAGGLKAFLIRGLRSFLHMVAVNGITILVGLFVLSLTAGLALALGPLANALAMVGGGVVIWMSIVLTGTAHLAIAAEARDRRETLPSAFMRARLFMVPIAASLGLLFLIAAVFYLVIGSLAISLVPESFEPRMGLIVSGFVVYLTSALHVAALYQVPDFRDLRPN